MRSSQHSDKDPARFGWVILSRQRPEGCLANDILPHWARPVKQKQALLRSNLPRDNLDEGDEIFVSDAGEV